MDEELAKILGKNEDEKEIEMKEASECDEEGNKIEKVKKKKKRRKKKKANLVYMHYKSSSEDEAEIMEQKMKMRKEYEEEQLKKLQEEEEAKKKLANEVEKEAGGYHDDDDSNPEIDFKEVEESDTDEEDRKKLMVAEPEEEEAETFATLRPETVDDRFFDAKKDLDSDSDLDEFGRLKDRQRPSSTLFDFLPPLKPDPRLDNGDITNCKNRLSKHVVIIREALARNERKFLKTYRLSHKEVQVFDEVFLDIQNIFFKYFLVI